MKTTDMRPELLWLNIKLKNTCPSVCVDEQNGDHAILPCGIKEILCCIPSSFQCALVDFPLTSPPSGGCALTAQGEECVLGSSLKEEHTTQAPSSPHLHPHQCFINYSEIDGWLIYDH